MLVHVLPWQIEQSRQYLLVHFNESLNTYWQLLSQDRETCSKLHHLYTTCSKCPPPSCTKIFDVDELRRRIKNEWTVWITLFIEHAVGIKVYIACSKDLPTAWPYRWSDLLHVWWFLRQELPVVFVVFSDSLKCTCKCCVDCSICHFKFSKVVVVFCWDTVYYYYFCCTCDEIYWITLCCGSLW